MEYTRQSAIDRLLESYQAYYNINKIENDELNLPLVALCEYYEHSEKFVISQKAELWSADCEEFLYLFDVEHMTLEIFEQCMDYIKGDCMNRAHIGPGHMYTYVTPVFICDTCDEAAKRALKKCRFYKSFRFSLHGWMEFHVAMFEVCTNTLTSNRAGWNVKKIMKKVLFNQKKRRKIKK